MKTIRCIIVDDELPSIKSLKWELEVVDFDVEILETCNSADEGIKAIKKHKPDLVFLDIAMPHKNGFDLLAELDAINFQVVFTTAYDEYAVKAFEINACDYLLKPIDNGKLAKALTRFMEVKSNNDITTRLEGLFNAIKLRKPGFSKLALSTMEGIEFINIDQIVRCESSSNYTFVYTNDGIKRVVSKTLGSIEESLKEHSFFRVHNSHLINVAFIHKYIRGKTGLLILDDGTSIPVSNSKKDFLDQIG